MDPHRIRLRTPHCKKADADQCELPNPGKLATLSTSVLALLAAETTDPTIIDAVAAQVEAGGHPTHADVRRLVDENNGRIPQDYMMIACHQDHSQRHPAATSPNQNRQPKPDH